MPFSKLDESRDKPEVLSAEWLTHSRLFHVQELELRFGNGEVRTYERLNPGAHRAVMIVPMIDDDTVLLVREYGAGVDDYYLSLPKGALEKGETVAEAANRELMEEVGYGARRLDPVTRLNLSPSYMGNGMDIVLARDLYEKRLPGDEPEEIEVIPYKIGDLTGLINRPDFREAYAVAALFLVRDMLMAGR